MATNGESPLPCYAAKSGPAASIFGTSIGKLQRQLHEGEYYMFRSTPMFESDFVQITKSGEPIDVHNHRDLVTVAVACTSPILPIPIPIPSVMLLAREATSCEQCHSQAPKRKKCKAEEPLELTRLLPLKFVKISVHDLEKQQLRLKFATGCSFYLQLCRPLDACEDLFTYWESLIDLLQPPLKGISGTYATPAEDILCLPALADADRASLASWYTYSRDSWDQVSIRSVHSDPELTGTTLDDQGRDSWDQVSIRSVHSDPKLTGTTLDNQGRDSWDHVSIPSIYEVPKVPGATSPAYASGEGDQPSSRTSTATPKVCTPETRSAGSAEASAPGTRREAAAAGVASGMPSVEAAQVNTALAEATFIGEGGSKSPVAGIGKTSPRSMSVALAGAGQFSEPVSSTASCFSPGDKASASSEGGEASPKEAGEAANAPAVGVRVREGPGGAEAGQQGSPRASRASRKEHRERREGRHKTERDKMAQKSSSRSLSGHRTHRVNKNEEGGHRRAKSSRDGHSPKGISHTRLEKKPRSSNKSRRNKSRRRSSSAESSESTPRRLSRFSSFLRKIRAKLGVKGVASLHGGDVDTVPRRVEETDLEAMVEMAECGQGVEVGSVTSEVMKTMTLRSP
ncbi:Protein FAM71A [Heterocephalus glaber]|uniref:Protein FAM71A n=1 Tax=Heterocephalus glaber TaxID=10181 RepID=G5AXT7_HETGA|nr:Protein FAM71A [Heterocephalus glaber]